MGEQIPTRNTVDEGGVNEVEKPNKTQIPNGKEAGRAEAVRIIGPGGENSAEHELNIKITPGGKWEDNIVKAKQTSSFSNQS